MLEEQVNTEENIVSVDNDQLNNNDAQEENKEEIKEPKRLSWKQKQQKMKEVYDNLGSKEKEAWDQGWRTEEFYAGKSKLGEDKPFVSAEEYLERANKALPVANERIKAIKEEKDREIEKLKDQIDKLVQYTQSKEERDIEQSYESLESQRQEAIMEADIDRVKEIELRQKSIKESKFNFEADQDLKNEVIQQPNQNQQYGLTNQEQQALSNWRAENSWYDNDPSIRAYAESLVPQLELQKHLSFEEKLNFIKDDVETTFKDRLGIKRHKRVAETGNNTSFGNSAKINSYNDLPVDAKKACDKLVSMKIMTKEEYVKSYYNNK